MQISGLAKSIRILADMKEPIGHVLSRMEVRKRSAELCNLDHQ